MRFDTPEFLFEFLPGLLALYFLSVAVASLPWRWAGAASHAATAVLLLTTGVAVVWQGRFAGLLLGVASLTFVCAIVIGRLRAHAERQALARAVVMLGVALSLGVFAYTRLQFEGRAFTPVGASVVACLTIAYLVDVYRGVADTKRPVSAALYLLQWPVLAAGPIARYRDFATQHARRAVSMGAFTYGVRRIVIGLVKVALFARVLAGPSDAMFALPMVTLTAAAAWLGALCFSLQLYFLFSGYSDIAIGLGRLVGFRYPENFRRPYTADSIREFWRRWNITLITWLRDYLYLPIAGRDDPTPRLYVNIVLGFVLVGLFHGAGSTVVAWALYSSMWLALEAMGLGIRVHRWPVPLRHAYVLLVVTIGWVILRADSMTGALAYLQAMVGVNGLLQTTTSAYGMTTWIWLVLAAAVLCAGPLVPWISRWRVSVDAATVSIMMMLAATGIFLWVGASLAVNALRPSRLREKIS